VNQIQNENYKKFLVLAAAVFLEVEVAADEIEDVRLHSSSAVSVSVSC